MVVFIFSRNSRSLPPVSSFICFILASSLTIYPGVHLKCYNNNNNNNNNNKYYNRNDFIVMIIIIILKMEKND